MGQQDWYPAWHGNAQIPATSIFGLSTSGGAGSTTMSTGLVSTLAGLAAQISTKAAGSHTHPTSDITGLDSSLAGLASAISTKAAGVHTHATADVSSLVSTLSGLAAAISTKAAGSHTHPTSDITNLDSSLAGLAAAISTKAAGTHTHATADVSSLVSTLSGLASAISTKAAGVHTHVMADITDLRASIPSTWVVLSTHVLTGSTALGNVTGLSFSVSSASAYRFEFPVGFQVTSSAAGMALSVSTPASPLLLAYEVMLSTGLGGGSYRFGRGSDGSSFVTTSYESTAVDGFASLWGLLRTGGTAGTLQLRFATRTAGSTVSVRAGSMGWLQGPL